MYATFVAAQYPAMSLAPDSNSKQYKNFFIFHISFFTFNKKKFFPLFSMKFLCLHFCSIIITQINIHLVYFSHNFIHIIRIFIVWWFNDTKEGWKKFEKKGKWKWEKNFLFVTTRHDDSNCDPELTTLRLSSVLSGITDGSCWMKEKIWK